jgi:serine/threonine protein kinase
MSSQHNTGYNPTTLEDGSPQHRQIAPTVLDTGTGTVLEDGAIISQVGAQLPTESFSGFVAVRRLSSASTEAEVFLAKNRETDEMRVVKWYYNVEHRPNHDVMEKLMTMDLHHIPRLFEHGISMNGRYFELMEYIDGGSLDDWITDEIPEDKEAKAIVREIVEALEHLEAQGISHRDLKPENILIRTRNPLDLVIVDFGLSRVTSGNLHKTKLGETPLYSPPEGGKFVHRNRDWWSLGIIAVKLRIGKHPWEKIEGDEQTRNERIIFNKNTLPAPIPPEIGPDWVLLAMGLLTRDPEKRWCASNVKRWLTGERNIPVFFETEIREVDTRPVFKDYERDLRMFSLSDVADVLVLPDWQANERLLVRGGFLLSDWIKKIGKSEVAVYLDEIIQDSTLSPCGKVAVAIWLFDTNDTLSLKANGNLHLRGEILSEQDAHLLFKNPEEFHLGSNEARAFVDESRIGYWQSRLTGQHWWNALRKRREAVLKIAKDEHVETDLRDFIADIFSIAPENRAISAALDIKNNFVYSPNVCFNRILQSGDNLSFADSWLLASANPKLLLNAGDNTRREFEERFGVLLPVLNAYRARKLNGLFQIRSTKLLLLIGLIGTFIFFLWPIPRRGLYLAGWGVLGWWFIIIPILGGLIPWSIRKYVLRLIGSEEPSVSPPPHTIEQWDALIQKREAACAEKIGGIGSGRKAALSEWKRAVSDCRRINKKSSAPNQIAIPRLNMGHGRFLIVMFQILLLLTPFIPPLFQQRGGMSLLRYEITNFFENSKLRSHSSDSAPTDSTPPLQGERYPETRRSRLSSSDLKGWSYAKLQYAINEMFARHGADFPNKAAIKRQFEQFDWYHPRPSLDFDQVEQGFSDVEKANLKALSAMRQSKSK